ncbi:hypothetical protein [Nocardia rhizosphaerae]|uniref:Bulb-type lectin domain-containing protein n=1 Tax=Nocardia rhizosphaerae TaxID=1691571 RepID=A0ABV8LCP7_9NOCA
MRSRLGTLYSFLRQGTLAFALAASAVTVLVATPPAHAQPHSFSSTDIGFAEGSGTDIAARLPAIASAVSPTVPILRLDLDWWYVEPHRGAALRWDRLDPVVDDAAARGMKVLLVLAYAPPWANGGHTDDKWFPLHDQDWTSIVDRTVQHFGDKVQAYEVWNEPNYVFFGNYASDRVARYWRLTELAYAGVKARCPACVVLAGASGAGTADATTNPNAPSVWLDWAYTHGYGDDFDAVAHHPYPAWNAGKGPADPECVNRWWNMFGPPAENPACGELALVHSVMAAHGDGDKLIWATEFGYPTAGSSALPNYATIRDYLVQGVRMWRALPYAGPLFLYSYRDRCTSPGDPECHFGLVTTTLAPKEPITSDVLAELGAAPLPDGDHRLTSGSVLSAGSALRSRNGRYELWLQSDGNLVLYRTDGRVIWATGTTNTRTLVNQTDGNLVLYRPNGRAAWSTRTWYRGPSTLVLQDDGNLVLRTDAGDRITWSTGLPPP